MRADGAGRRVSASVLAAMLLVAALALVIGVLSGPAVQRPQAAATTASTGTDPLFRTWRPPADLPTHGTVTTLTGEQRIPSSAGFAPRDASLYLPPAALVKDAPALPLVVFMMGQPGDPDPEPIQAAMDDLAARHQGLAPIVVVADQLGTPDANPACVDSSAYGGVHTYFSEDIPAWARAHLRIQDAPAAWTIAGFSNGGGCALDWGLADPDVWGSVVSIAGESYQGTEHPDEVLQEAFGGDRVAYEAAKPAAKAVENAGRFGGHVAEFAAGTQDAPFTEQVRLSARIAHDAGFSTQVFAIPGEDHSGALPEGLRKTFGALFPHLGLAAPGS